MIRRHDSQKYLNTLCEIVFSQYSDQEIADNFREHTNAVIARLEESDPFTFFEDFKPAWLARLRRLSEFTDKEIVEKCRKEFIAALIKNYGEPDPESPAWKQWSNNSWKLLKNKLDEAPLDIGTWLGRECTYSILHRYASPARLTSQVNSLANRDAQGLLHQLDKSGVLPKAKRERLDFPNVRLEPRIFARYMSDTNEIIMHPALIKDPRLFSFIFKHEFAHFLQVNLNDGDIAESLPDLGVSSKVLREMQASPENFANAQEKLIEHQADALAVSTGHPTDINYFLDRSNDFEQQRHKVFHIAMNAESSPLYDPFHETLKSEEISTDMSNGFLAALRNPTFSSLIKEYDRECAHIHEYERVLHAGELAETRRRDDIISLFGQITR